MDNLTHTLAAVAMSQAGLRRFTPHATITLIVASNLSDLDIVTVLQGSTAYLEHHRGITHSLVGVTALAGILAALMIAGSGLLARMRGRPPGKLSFLPLFGVCLAGTASHLLLDFTNSYGVRPFLPFSGKWYAWDILFIIDPLVIMALVAALILPALLRMVAEEVGARKPKYSWGPAVGLGSVNTNGHNHVTMRRWNSRKLNTNGSRHTCRCSAATSANQQVLNAILYVAEHGCKWRGLPARFGNSHPLHPHESLVEERGARPGLRACSENYEAVSLDSTIVQVSRRDGGAKKNGPQAIGRSRGGWTTKIHMVAADARTAVTFSLSTLDKPTTLQKGVSC